MEQIYLFWNVEQILYKEFNKKGIESMNLWRQEYKFFYRTIFTFLAHFVYLLVYSFYEEQ